ncbi:60S ribosomal protein L23a-like [Arvicola amphibius]|uniref:60S ribosomal protein L23a-like n=1 Tax=Arvicola amphibius TaxID=1047088 RepID=UPI001C085C35|nr:60S ribosomal protein L23a-like [Arvicola amphibius]
MASKAKKEAPAPPKAESKMRALKTKKAVLKDIHTHVTHLPVSQDSAAREAGLIHLKEQAQEEQGWPLCHHKIPLITDSAPKKTEDNTLVMSRPTSTRSNRLWENSRTLLWPKGNALIRDDREKKAFVLSAPDMMLWVLPTKLRSSKLSPAG